MKKSLVILALLTVPVLLPQTVVRANATVPLRTDDGLDPVNLVFTGYAPAWWVAQNLRGWNVTPCSEPKTVDGKTYDFTLETPDARSQSPPCWGPRYHIRLWDMGIDSLFGTWTIVAVHHEHTECPNNLCRHVIDGWESAEALVRSMFLNGANTESVSNYTLNNAGFYQGFYNDGNATLVQLAQPSTFSLTFQEAGLPQGQSWSVTLNGTTSSSTRNSLIFTRPRGTYLYTTGDVPGFNSTPSSGRLTITGDSSVSLKFARTLESTLNLPGVKLFLSVTVAAWVLVFASGVTVALRRRRKELHVGGRQDYKQRQPPDLVVTVHACSLGST